MQSRWKGCPQCNWQGQAQWMHKRVIMAYTMLKQMLNPCRGNEVLLMAHHNYVLVRLYVKGSLANHALLAHMFLGTSVG
eukprot:1918409-Amphidinium_carterae.1